MNIDTVLGYLPTEHGEHGIDSVIHRLIQKEKQLHESYCNPPGASWAEIIVQNPTSGEFYSWDHIPREPNCAKRPDAIIQFNQNHQINFLAIESKEKISNIYRDMDKLLKTFFNGNVRFTGLIDRPTQHRKNPTDGKWKFIGDNVTFDAYWIQKVRKNIKLYSGFAFGFEPEYYEDIQLFDDASWTKKMIELRKKHSLDLIVGIGWHDVHHDPFMKIIPSDSFSQTNFYALLKSTLVKN